MYQLAIAAIIAALMSGIGTWKVQEWRYDSKELARVEAGRELTKMNNAAANAASTEHEKTKTKIEKEYLVVTKEVENVITKIEYRDRICFDDDGLRALNRAVGLTGTASKPSNAVSAPRVP